MSPARVRPFEPFDVSVLAAEGHLWVSGSSNQGSVYGVPRPRPVWALPDQHAAPVDWLTTSIRHARTEAAGEALVVGELLTEVTFGVPEIAALLQQTRGVAAARGAQLLVRVLAAPQEITAWPWELVLDPQQPGRFLTLARDAHVVRAGRARTYPVRAAMIEPPLNMLMVLSSPLRERLTDTETPFDLYAEKRALLSELQPFVDRGLLHVEVEDRPSIERLRSRMAAQRRGFHILHYLGHAQPAGLKLEQRSGRGRLVSSAEFSLLLQQLPDLRLAVFAGCETARAPASPPGAQPLWPGELSTADYCVRDACPMVVGMQAVLPFGTERLFTRYFYQALTGGQSVAEALRLARMAIADDEHAGGRLLNWAVPCLFVGGSEPGPLLDPEARVTPPPPRRRVGLRLGVRQGELRFISRLTELREAVDVLSARNAARVLMVIGLPGTGKSSFLDRAVEELDSSIAYLLVSVERLLEEEDSLQFLAQRVCEVLARAGRKPRTQGRNSAGVWWEHILEDLSETPFALAIDDADLLRGDDARIVALREALCDLTRRRGLARLALAADDDLVAITGMLAPGQVRTIRLQALSWPEVWQWIRRNLPVLTRYGEARLSPLYADLPRLEDWERLADEITNRGAVTDDDLSELARRIGRTLVAAPAASAPPSAPPGAPPAPPLIGSDVFGGAAPGAAAAVAPEIEQPAVPPVPDARRTLRVAVAGPFTNRRIEEFARGITQYAAEHHVAGRVADVSTEGASRLAELLPLDTPFDEQGAASTATILNWLGDAVTAADVVLLDFGTTGPALLWEELLDSVASDSRLLIAAGGNSGEPTYPAWSPHVLAVGAALPDGSPAPYSVHFPDEDKPEIFAPETVDGTPLEILVAQRGLRGTSFAAMHVLAAVVLVWATDRGLPASEVRSILVQTARVVPQPDGTSIRLLDVDAALTHTRRQLLFDALEWEPRGLHELLAQTGMPSELALPIIDAAVSAGELHSTVVNGEERFEKPDSVASAYARIRSLPAGPARTYELERLLDRVRTLARRGRFCNDDVKAMWDSGLEVRRLAALAAMQAMPHLGSPALVAAAVTAPRTTFEQYHALRVAQEMLPGLDEAGRAMIARAITAQRGPAGTLTKDGARDALASQVMAAIEGSADSGDALAG